MLVGCLRWRAISQKRLLKNYRWPLKKNVRHNAQFLVKALVCSLWWKQFFLSTEQKHWAPPWLVKSKMKGLLFHTRIVFLQDVDVTVQQVQFSWQIPNPCSDNFISISTFVGDGDTTGHPVEKYYANSLVGLLIHIRKMGRDTSTRG